MGSSGRAGGVGAGSILAAVAFGTTLHSYTISSATPAAVDAANLTITFTAPGSGNVGIDLEATCFGIETPSPINVWWGVGPHGGAPTLTTFAFITASPFSERFRHFCRLTGLTPGQSYQYDWMWGADTGGSTIGMYAGGTATNPLTNANTGPATMVAIQLP